MKRDIKIKIYFNSGIAKDLCIGNFESYREAMNYLLQGKWNVGEDYVFNRDSIEFIEEIK